MKRLSYFLILLLLSAQVDDALAAVCNLPPDPLADVNDEYLPSQRRAREEQPVPDQAPVAVAPEKDTVLWFATFVAESRSSQSALTFAAGARDAAAELSEFPPPNFRVTDFKDCIPATADIDNVFRPQSFD